METIGVVQLIAFFVLLLLAAFFSSAESAYSSVSKLRIKSLADEGNKKAQKVYALLEQPSKMLTSVFIANLTILIAIATITTLFTINTFGYSYVLLSISIVSIIVIVFAELTPKFIASTYADKLSLAYIDLISAFTKIMSPFSFVFNGISQGILKLFNIKPEETNYKITEDELLTIVDESHKEGVIESEERKMIANVVDFGDSITKDVMVPRTDIKFGSIDMSYDELAAIFYEFKFTRIPIYSDSRDNVVGIINLKDLFFNVKNPDDFSIEDIMREPYFTYEYKRTFELFHEMKTKSIAIAIVLDEYGETAGLVTLEDLIEEIVGEIRDEYDEDEEDDIQVIGDNKFLIDGNTNVDDINDALGTELEPIEYENIAGHMIYLFDHLPKEGETVTEQNVVLTVDSIEKNRISKIRLEILPEEDENYEDTDVESIYHEDLDDENSDNNFDNYDEGFYNDTDKAD